MPEFMTADEVAEYTREYQNYLDATEPAPADEPYDRPMTPTEALWSARVRDLIEQYAAAGLPRAA